MNPTESWIIIRITSNGFPVTKWEGLASDTTDALDQATETGAIMHSGVYIVALAEAKLSELAQTTRNRVITVTKAEPVPPPKPFTYTDGIPGNPTALYKGDTPHVIEYDCGNGRWSRENVFHSVTKGRPTTYASKQAAEAALAKPPSGADQRGNKYRVVPA